VEVLVRRPALDAWIDEQQTTAIPAVDFFGALKTTGPLKVLASIKDSP